MKEILLVGRRHAATEAARKIGCGFSIQETRSRDEQAAGAFGGTVEDAVAAARKHYRGAPPNAVLAVAEGAVPAAAAIREKFGIPGLSPECALRCHDKLIMKKAVDEAGIPCAPWLETDAGTTPEEILDRLGSPAVLKLPASSGGRGVAICATRDEIASVLSPGLLVEKFTPGVEMSVETLRRKKRTLFRNHTRYLVPHWASIVPADLPAGDDRASVDTLADRVHDALGIGEGMTHMEIFLTPEGPVFSEIAARPPGGRLMEIISRAYDFDAWEAVIRIALNEKPDLPARAAQFAGAWLLYPDRPGVVASVGGLDRARAVPGVARVTCPARPGRHFGERLGTGQSAGEIIVVTDTAAECERRMREAHDAIAFEIAPEDESI